MLDEKFEGDYDDFEIESLQNMVDENRKAIEDLEFENYILDRYIKRLNIKPESQDDNATPGVGRSSRNRSRVRSFGAERNLRLSAEQKCTIAKVEIEGMGQEIITYKREAESKLDSQRALYDEAELQKEQMEKFRYNYNKATTRQVFPAQQNQLTAEKIVRFLEEMCRAQDTLVDKYRLHNSTLRSQRKKLLSQQKQKEEMGEVLHEVDFEQLKIENTQFLEIIDSKNQELVRLKLTAGRTTQAANALKRKLAQLSQESVELQNEIRSRQELVGKTKTEIGQVFRQEKQKMEAQVVRLKQLMEDYDVPSVMDYVNSVKAMRQLKRRELVQSRKLAIAKTNLEKHRRIWQHLQRTNALQPY